MFFWVGELWGFMRGCITFHTNWREKERVKQEALLDVKQKGTDFTRRNGVVWKEPKGKYTAKKMQVGNTVVLWVAGQVQQV